MENISDYLNTPQSKFFKQINEELSSMKCDNKICIKNNLPSTKMFDTKNIDGNVKFEIIKDAICCSSFEEALKKRVEIIYQNYKP